MQRKNVTSSNISSIGYDAESKVLEVEFLKGEIYQYKSVPESVYFEIMTASSHGVYLNQYVKDIYDVVKIN